MFRIEHWPSTTAVAAAVLAIASSSVARAADAPPPRWDIVEVCSTIGHNAGACPRVESDTRRALLDRWTALPAANRIACTQKVDIAGLRSYRSLAACIDELALKTFENGKDIVPPRNGSVEQ